MPFYGPQNLLVKGLIGSNLKWVKIVHLTAKSHQKQQQDRSQHGHYSKANVQNREEKISRVFFKIRRQCTKTTSRASNDRGTALLLTTLYRFFGALRHVEGGHC
jgi:hypothetical protein